MTPQEEGRVHRLFVVSLALKGADAVLEIAAALLLAVVSAGTVSRLLIGLAQKELTAHPADPIAGYIRGAAETFSADAKTFAVLYLLSHGVIKLGLVVGLLRDRAWAYPASLIAFAAFIVYQVYRYSFTGSPMLIVLTVFDLVVLALVWHEYRRRLPSRKTA